MFFQGVSKKKKVLQNCKFLSRCYRAPSCLVQELFCAFMLSYNKGVLIPIKIDLPGSVKGTIMVIKKKVGSWEKWDNTTYYFYVPKNDVK